MPPNTTTHTFEVFQWTGTYYGAQYNESHTAVFEDNDGDYDGQGDGNERVTIDGGQELKTTGEPYKIEVSFTDTSGDPHVEEFYFFNAGDNWYFAPGPGSEFTVGATLGNYQSHTTGWQYDEVVCFTAGTLIETDMGPQPVESLRAGTKILTESGHFKPLRQNLCREVSAAELAGNVKLRPVCISAGALGNGLPQRDLRVSRQHRMLVQSRITERMLGTPQTLVAAIKLCTLPGIFLDKTLSSLSYHHLLFDTHEVIFAEGAPSESLFTGPEALRMLAPEGQAELQLLFPDLKPEIPAAHHIASPLNQKRLVARHGKNGQPLLETR